MARHRVTQRGKDSRWSALAGKSRWTAAEARSLLEAHSRSGEPLAGFARRHALALPRLYAWRRRLNGTDAGARATRFLPVRIVSGRAIPQASEIEIVLASGHRIRVAETFDPAALGRVIDVLGRPTC